MSELRKYKVTARVDYRDGRVLTRDFDVRARDRSNAIDRVEIRLFNDGAVMLSAKVSDALDVVAETDV